MRATADHAATPAGRPRRRRLIVTLGAVAVVLIAAGLVTAVYTERPQFCPVCHEMGPYYDAWVAGPHSETSCVECHVDPGVVAHGLHKFVALREVWDHFTKDNRFPTYGVELPNSRCIRCHDRVRTATGSRFDHQLHADKAPCKDCHATTGHTVTTVALASAGVLNVRATPPLLPATQNASALPGHITVTCQRCHDQAKMRCAQCHTAPHEVRGDCAQCHRPGTKFAFAHPLAPDCGRCHRAPASHFGPSCSTCHRPGIAFAKATFRHPGNTGEHSFRSFACVKCHPKSFSSASCTCHGGRPPKGD